MGMRIKGKLRFDPNADSWLGTDDDGTFGLKFKGTTLISATAAGILSSGKLGNLLPGADNTYDLGSASYSWRDLFVDRNALVGGTLGVTGAVSLTAGLTVGTTLGVTGVTTPTGGVAAAGGFSISPRNWHTGSKPATLSTDGTNLDIVVTELYVAEVFIPANATITGVAVFNGTAVAGNLKVCLFDSAGNRVAISASTAASGTTAFQRIAFTGTYAAKGPATYYVGVIGDNNGGDLRAHVFGNFGAGKITGLVYATESGYASITPPTTFTTGLGPFASLY